MFSAVTSGSERTCVWLHQNVTFIPLSAELQNKSKTKKQTWWKSCFETSKQQDESHFTLSQTAPTLSLLFGHFILFCSYICQWACINKAPPPRSEKHKTEPSVLLCLRLSAAHFQTTGRKQALPSDLFFPENIFMINLTPRITRAGDCVCRARLLPHHLVPPAPLWQRR